MVYLGFLELSLILLDFGLHLAFTEYDFVLLHLLVLVEEFNGWKKKVVLGLDNGIVHLFQEIQGLFVNLLMGARVYQQTIVFVLGVFGQRSGKLKIVFYLFVWNF